MEIKSKDDLVNFLTDLDGRIENLTETVDKLSPVEEEEETEDQPDTLNGTTEPTEDEVNEVDKLLQED